MNLSPYFNLYFMILALQLGYYAMRQRMLTGAYAIAAFSIVAGAFTLASFLGFVSPNFREPAFLEPYTITIYLTALILSYIPAIRNQLNAFLKNLWFNSLIAITLAGLSAIIFQIASQTIMAYTPYALNALTGCTYYLGFLILLITYYSMPLYYQHMTRKKYEMIGFQLESILNALDQELVTYKLQLEQLKTADGPEAQPLLLNSLEEKLAASKLPIYADSTDVSMALYPYLTESAAANTWLDAKLFPLATADLSCLLAILCSYFKAYDDDLLLGIQLTPLTEGKIYFELKVDVFDAKHLKDLIRHQKMTTPDKSFANQHINRMCLRYLFAQYKLSLKHIVLDGTRQAVVLSAE